MTYDTIDQILRLYQEYRAAKDVIWAKYKAGPVFERDQAYEPARRALRTKYEALIAGVR